ncbi:sulfite exporter TauE/SafE family protein [Corynebacterium sp. CCUG 59401]|nr:sulfite exporter TauE/SafE family protein [Corynebacterium pseudogenitalium]
MDVLPSILLFFMGIMAGIINSAVGSGSLLTLPVLLAMGVPPGVAVRTNTIGLMFASFGSAWGFRHETKREMPWLRPLIIMTIIGAASGSLLLLFTPTRALDFVIPILIVVALLLVVFQQRIVDTLARMGKDAETRNAEVQAESDEPVGEAYKKPGLVGAMGLASVYGGFFTAAQGIIYLAVMGVGTGRSFKDVNPVKNFLSMIVNTVAALVYLIAYLFFGAEVLWLGVLILAAGGVIGGLVGARIAKRVSNRFLKGVIVVVAVIALIRQFI